MNNLQVCKYTLQKFGNKPEENEDVVDFKKIPKKSNNTRELRCVISDGATQTSFSSFWANILVKRALLSGYVPSRIKLFRILQNASCDWKNHIANIDLPWYAEEKVKKGSFATILWMSFSVNRQNCYSDGTWKALAVGDSNLLVIRDKVIQYAFPISQSSDFDSTPHLLGSLYSHEGNIKISRKQGHWMPGDDYLLASDAVAQYLLFQFESGKSVISELMDLHLFSDQGSSNFQNWISDLRNRKNIKNDDSSILWIRFPIFD